ncbi:hypothetical protein ABIA45_007259 [Bradyrhizobium sp. USDA 336]
MGMLMSGLPFRRIHHNALCSEVVEHGGSLVSCSQVGELSGADCLPHGTEQRCPAAQHRAKDSDGFAILWQAMRSSICSRTLRVGRCSAAPQALVGSGALNAIEDRQQVDRRSKADPISAGRTTVSDLGLADRGRADARGNTRRAKSVPHKPGTAIRGFSSAASTEMPVARSQSPQRAAHRLRSAEFLSVDRQSPANGKRGSWQSYSLEVFPWRFAFRERFWQTRHPPRYAASPA